MRSFTSRFQEEDEMNGVEYCVIHSSWPCHRDLSDCARYVLQQSDNSKPEGGSANSDVHVFTLDGTTSDPESPCTIHLKCKHQYAVALTGGEIISESRTIELYDVSGAYLMSCRGQFLQSTAGDDGNEGARNLFSCRFSLDEPVFALTIKFLSLQGKKKCDVSRLLFFLSHSDVRNQSCQPKQKGNIDLEKVKGYLHSMGNNIAPNASDLLKSVEQYQQTQMSGLGQLQSVLSRLSPTESGTENQSGGMSAFISMMSQLDQSPAANNGQERGELDTGMMYRMLKDVCGKVTHMRNCKTKSTAETAEPSEQQGTNSCSGSSSVPESAVPSHSNEKSGNGLTIDSVRLTFEKMLTEQMQKTEERLKSYINEKFSQMEAHLTQKLDILINDTKRDLQCDIKQSTYSSTASQVSTEILDTVIREICESRSKSMTTETGKSQNGNENANTDCIELD